MFHPQLVPCPQPKGSIPQTHQLQALVPEFTVVLLQLFCLFFQLLVVSRDFLLSLDQVIVGQSFNSQLKGER